MGSNIAQYHLLKMKFRVNFFLFENAFETSVSGTDSTTHSIESAKVNFLQLKLQLTTSTKSKTLDYHVVLSVGASHHQSVDG